jgi:hypothetical protein
MDAVGNFQPLSTVTASVGGKPSRGPRLSPSENGVCPKLHRVRGVLDLVHPVELDGGLWARVGMQGATNPSARMREAAIRRNSGLLRTAANVMIPRSSPHLHLRDSKEEQNGQADEAHYGQRNVFAVPHLTPPK